MSGQLDISTSTELALRLNFAQQANEAARLSAFANYRSRRAQNTLRRQEVELANFGAYVGADDLAIDPQAWTGISWGIIESFVKKLLLDSYAVGSVNNHLSTIKTYAKLATKAGTIHPQVHAMIRMVSGYSHKEKRRIDEQREAADIDIRLGDKKAGFLVLSMEQEVLLKYSCNKKPQGLRDRVLLMLLLDLGLRVSEVADLQTDDFNPETGMLEVYRRKTDSTTTFELHNEKLKAMRDYFDEVKPRGQLLKGSRKGGKLKGKMSSRAIRYRVKKMGESIGMDNLSPHDLRHTRATRLAGIKNMRELMDWFGWNSPVMAARYIERAEYITVD
jgi:integrase/recombinase XerC